MHDVESYHNQVGEILWCRYCQKRAAVWRNGYCSPECSLEGEKPKPLTLEERFMKSIVLSEEIPTPTNGKVFTTHCWLWTGMVLGQKGHKTPQISLKGKRYNASRMAWTLFKDEPINGRVVIHACQNRLCVNPDHLFLGTQRDAIRNGRGGKNLSL